MTLIVTDGITVAADSRKAHEGGVIFPGKAQKLVERDERIFGFSGTMCLFEPCIEWYLAGMEMDSPPWEHLPDKTNCASLWIFEAGKLFQVVYETPLKEEMSMPAMLGCMRDYAMGVLDEGGTPERAVSLARERHFGIGGEVQVIRLPDHLRIPRI